MTNNISDIRSAVKKVAWGFFLIHIHFNLGSIDILPDWAGYALIVSALSAIALEQESAKLIRPFGIFLVAWSTIDWIVKIFGLQIYLNYISLIPSAINLYFTFQLFTNLAAIADKYSCPQTKKLLVLRTVNVIFTVSNTFLLYFGIITEGGEIYTALMVAILVAALIIMLAMLITLFSFASSLGDIEDKLQQALSQAPQDAANPMSYYQTPQSDVPYGAPTEEADGNAQE